MRNRLIVFAATIALCSPGLADEPAPSNKSANEASLRALIERLEARVSELEKQVQQLKRAQQQSVLGGSLLEAEPFQL
ncbi:MAG: hypothetical protein HYV60_23010, partial [Planctomycetia bacterium]|nr:hypothetical protein [Planctomycetia bacterium]